MTSPTAQRPQIGRTIRAAITALFIALSVVAIAAPSARAEVGGKALGNFSSRWAPYNNSPEESDYHTGDSVSIICYVVGDSVSGPYGTENIWDMTNSAVGDFVPDALIYTGSNSAVVPRCTTGAGRAIGNSPVTVYQGGASVNNVHSGFTLQVGQWAGLLCYAVGDPVAGPYGTEAIWDELTIEPLWHGGRWVPDALIYTGSNGPTVPHC